MKRFCCLLLCLSLLLTGCGFFGERIKEPVTFYYLRDEYQFGSGGGVIGSEIREASGHRDSLSYLLALYLIGPSDEELHSPIPRGINIFSAELVENTVKLKLSDTSASLTDAGFSLACACLTLTCLDLTGAEEVTITSGSRSVTMSRDNLTLFDSTTAAPEETQ